MDWEVLNQLARERFNQRPTPAMMLMIWAEKDPEGLISLIQPHGLDQASFMSTLQTLIDQRGQDDSRSLITDVILRAKDGQPTARDLLAVICAHPEQPVARALAEAGLDLAGLGRTLARERTRQNPPSCLAHLGISLDTSSVPLLKYGRDLTALAKEGCFDGYCIRPDELDQLATVLMKMERPNPALIGEAGVGKTALIELLAREVVAGRIGIDPKTRIFEISIGKLAAGTRYRGDFEARVEEVVQAVLKSAPAILFLDEAHLLFGTGRAEGAPMDMSNLLKPFLARGDLRVIAATTADEFTRYIAQDEALARRFEQVRIPEPDPQLTIRMVETRATALARHHGIEISDKMVSRAIALSNEHLPQKLQPYKAIDLLDTAMAKACRMDKRGLDESILLETLAKSLGRAVEELQGGERRLLRDLKGFLQSRIVGQEEAIEKIVSTIVRQRQQLGSTERNRGTFLLVGPTGIGKTELARQLAVGLYGSLRDLILFDMGEYAELASINKLIGAPAGLIGSDREGVLIRWLQNHPAGGVLIFDEIEKAHGEVHNLLLGILDNGRVRSAQGRAMDCRHCVVILTSNAISTEDLAKAPLGFGTAQQRTVHPADLLTKVFPREFLGRLDEIILFKALGEEEILKIVRIRLEEATERLRRRSIKLHCDMERLANHLADKLRGLRFGARGIEHLIEQTILGPISLAMLRVDDEGEMEAVIGDAFYEKGEVELRIEEER
jgi:ATP-dependent Clp protease ATP-binding subunit ClpA